MSTRMHTHKFAPPTFTFTVSKAFAAQSQAAQEAAIDKLSCDIHSAYKSAMQAAIEQAGPDLDKQTAAAAHAIDQVEREEVPRLVALAGFRLPEWGDGPVKVTDYERDPVTKEIIRTMQRAI